MSPLSDETQHITKQQKGMKIVWYFSIRTHHIEASHRLRGDFVFRGVEEEEEAAGMSMTSSTGNAEIL